jgi:hypothetical protein
MRTQHFLLIGCSIALSLLGLLLLTTTLAASQPDSSSAQYTGGISGRVTDADTGLPLQNVDVWVSPGYDLIIAHATTDAAGQYTVTNLAPNHYSVGFYPSDLFHLSGGAAATVTTTTVTVNAELALGGAFSSRLVSRHTGRALTQGVELSLYYDSVQMQIICVAPACPEVITVRHLAPGTDYKVGFSARGYISQFYNDEPDLQSADPITITPGVLTTGIDAYMDSFILYLPILSH